ncbi:hypothetical protein [Xanthomonas arboricola]|uniref:Winged helix DNA-binding domain-containing protein n=1 Tax=Xanthomonas arboricola TaxID=56448 RepID=A0AB73H2C8_9XANT|nr:hypothetical protein [Xanthomonas arboricola]MBB5672353.1 hypothetical protein [Xanthomonas arboricola]
MPDLSFLDLYEHEGHLHQLTGSLTVDELLAQQERHERPPADDALWHTIRAFSIAPHRSRHGAPLATVASLQSATLRVLQSLLRSQTTTSYERTLHTLCFAWDPARRSARRLYGRNLAENVTTWLRTADAEQTLVEVPLSEPASIEAVIREMRTYLGQLQQSMASETAAGPTPPEARPADAAAARRLHLSRAWPTAAEVSRQLGSTAGNGSHRANQLRRDGQLLGVWLPSEQAYRFPVWQFGVDGRPVPPLAELLALLRGAGGMDTQDRLTSGWGEVEWFLTPHALLDGASPAEVLPDDSARVLAVAQEEFREPADARW